MIKTKSDTSSFICLFIFLSIIITTNINIISSRQFNEPAKSPFELNTEFESPLLDSNDPLTFSSSSSSSNIQCEPININLCSKMAYQSTRMPNFFNDSNQIEALDRAPLYENLVNSKCSQFIHAYICELLTPVCLEDSLEAMKRFKIFPCRSFCRRIKRDCEDQISQLNEQLFNQGSTSLIPGFACEKLPYESNGGNGTNRGPCHETPELNLNTNSHQRASMMSAGANSASSVMATSGVSTSLTSPTGPTSPTSPTSLTNPTNPTNSASFSGLSGATNAVSSSSGTANNQNQLYHQSHQQTQQTMQIIKQTQYRPFQPLLDTNIPPFITDTSKIDTNSIKQPGNKDDDFIEQVATINKYNEQRDKNKQTFFNQLYLIGQNSILLIIRYSNVLSIIVILILLALYFTYFKNNLTSNKNSSKLNIETNLNNKLINFNHQAISPSSSSRSLMLIAGNGNQPPKHKISTTNEHREPSQKLVHGLNGKHKTLINLNTTLDRKNQINSNRYNLMLHSIQPSTKNQPSFKSSFNERPSDKQQLFNNNNATLDSQSSSNQYEDIYVTNKQGQDFRQQQRLYSNILLSSPSHQVLLIPGDHQNQRQFNCNQKARYSRSRSPTEQAPPIPTFPNSHLSWQFPPSGERT